MIMYINYVPLLPYVYDGRQAFTGLLSFNYGPGAYCHKWKESKYEKKIPLHLSKNEAVNLYKYRKR